MASSSSSLQKSKWIRVLYMVIPGAFGVAWAIVALTHGPTMAYVVVAVVAVICYALVMMADHRRR